MSENSLAGVRANFQCIAERGWFLPRSSGEEQVRTFLCSKKGGALGYRRAAVLGLISYHSNKLHILLTKRSENISFNGHAALPGGMQDSMDLSPAHTALREAEEEIGLDRNKVEVVCTLPPQVTTLSGLTAVNLVVALLKCSPEELNLSPNPLEVDCIYWVPLELFTTAQSPHIPGKKLQWYEYVLEHKEPRSGVTHRIWGFTAFMCVLMACIAHNQPFDSSTRPPPMLISRLERKGNTMIATCTTIALTQTQVAMITSSKL